jgi:putative acetyltransferase
MFAPTIRDEREADAGATRAVTRVAFANMPYSQQTEAAIVEALRAAGALALSLVAVEDGEVVGHVAFSAVTIDGAPAPGWFGAGPLSVRPDRQRSGIGTALMRAGLARLAEAGAKGCVLVGDPVYYLRFGFREASSLAYPGLPAVWLQVLALAAAEPRGTVAFHAAFAVRDDD